MCSKIGIAIYSLNIAIYSLNHNLIDYAMWEMDFFLVPGAEDGVTYSESFLSRPDDFPGNTLIPLCDV